MPSDRGTSSPITESARPEAAPTQVAPAADSSCAGPAASEPASAAVTGSEAAEITRLLGVAHGRGERRDVFLGKRRWARYYLGTRLEISTDLDSSGATRLAVMHNVSAGGIAFWTRDQLGPDTKIFIRDWSADAPKPWVAARVTHATLGVSGYLVGAEFENGPDQRFAEDFAAPAERTSQPEAAAPGAGAGSLWTRCIGLAAAAGALGAAGGLLWQQVWPQMPEAWLPSLTIALVAVLSGLGASLAVRPSVRFLNVLCDEIGNTGNAPATERAPLGAPCRELARVLAALADLRARWTTREQDERVQRQKLEELNIVKSNVLNMVSHDLRTPLTSIRLYSEMLALDYKSLAEADQRQFLDIITEECKRLSRLVDDLLEAQRLEAGRVRWDMRPQDVSKLLRACARVFDPMARSRSIALHLDCPASLPTIEADADKLSQVLSNLVSNALKYTQVGGSVQISAHASADEIVICVSDNGPGIPRDKWDQIFDRFSQVPVSFVREISGVGLGLYIVRQIVAHHSGRVWVDSDLGKGSAFYVALPRQAPAEAAAAPGAELRSAGRVVVCDADPELANRIMQALNRQHFEVRVAYSGCRLLAQVLESQPEVVVTDVLLPDMDSGDLLTSLCDLKGRQHFRLVVHTYVGAPLELRRRGADIVLGRPAKPQELLQSVQVALKVKSASGLTVLMLAAPSLDTPRLSHVFLQAGHIPLTARTWAQAAEIARDHPVDVVLVAEEALGQGWSQLHQLLPPADRYWRLVVLAARLGRQQRRTAAAHGVTALAYNPGRETELVAEIATRLATVMEDVMP